MSGRPLGSSANSRQRSSVQRSSPSSLAQAGQSTPRSPLRRGSGPGGASARGRTGPSNGQVAHSSTRGLRRPPAARAWMSWALSGIAADPSPARFRRVEWPRQFYAWRAGDGCPACEEGRPDSTAVGVRFFAGDVSDAYLIRADIQRGLSIVVWRGRHVAEPTQLSDDEAAAYGREVLVVGRALETTFSALKMNYDV